MVIKLLILGLCLVFGGLNVFRACSCELNKDELVFASAFLGIAVLVWFI